MFTAADLRWSCNELCIAQGLNLAQMFLTELPGQSTMNNFPQQMWYQKKQEKLFFQYYIKLDVMKNVAETNKWNEMKLSLSRGNNGPLSKCKLVSDLHGSLEVAHNQNGKRNSPAIQASEEKLITWDLKKRCVVLLIAKGRSINQHLLPARIITFSEMYLFCTALGEKQNMIYLTKLGQMCT